VCGAYDVSACDYPILRTSVSQTRRLSMVMVMVMVFVFVFVMLVWC
jgi:hypothetical protein